MKAQDFVRATTAYHDELCPAAWDGTEMKIEVRTRLLEIAQLFVEYIDIPDFQVYDVVLAGSLANYNWTEFSDFDLHVVTDYKNINSDNLAEAFYRAIKTIWNDRHDIKIFNHEVELYVEDINEPPVSGGLFSVYNGQWIKTPAHQNPNINDTAIVRKVHKLQFEIEQSIATADDPEDLKRLTTKLRTLRQSGLSTGGEASNENLAYKTLRNMGLLKALHDAYINKQDALLSMNESGFNWTDYPNTPVDDLMIIAEEYFTRNGKLFESNDPDRSKYFLELEAMSSPLVANKKYISVLLSMVGNRVAQMSYPEVVTLLGKTGNVYNVILSNGDKVKFPDTRISDKMTSATFFFDNETAYDKFRTIMSMKFDMQLAGTDEVKGYSENLKEFAPGGGFEPPKRPPVPGRRRDDDDERPEIMPLADVAKAIMMHIGDEFTCDRMRDYTGKFNKLQPGYKFTPKDNTKFGMAKIWCAADRRTGEYPVYHTNLYTYFPGSDGRVLAQGKMVEKMKQKTNRNALQTAELIYGNTAGALKPVSEHIVKVGNEYELKSKKTGKNLGKYPTKAGAEKRERQVQYFKHKPQ